MKDLETLEKPYKKADGEAKTGNKEAQKDLELFKKVKELLDSGKLLNSDPEILESERLREFNFLTAKKQLYLLNGSESDVSEELKNKIKEAGAGYVAIDLAKDVDLETLIKKAYEILGLISFFTTPTSQSELRPKGVGAGSDETRAWTIRKGSLAPEAAGAIHSDFEDKFIRAEVIHWEKLVEAGDWSKARQKGLLRIEGKEYVVQDGDVMVIRHG